jgi:hypothetical protein
MLKRFMLVFVLAAALTPVAAFAAAPGSDASTNANAACTAQKAKLGATAFAQAYGTNADRSNAFGVCVSRIGQVEQQNTTSAQDSCSALQSDANFAANHGGKTFAQFYGTGKNGSNAMGKCVSTFAKASSQAEQQGRVNPAQTCRASRTQMGPSAFGQLYGKNANDRNAFGKCVSQVARAQSQNEVSAATACRAEQGDANFAASHSGQTFAQAYGTNTDDTNAFGKCVSSKSTEKSTTQQQATVSAAKACLAEENAGAAAFRSKYGTNASKSDAFGMCVSQKASTK